MTRPGAALAEMRLAVRRDLADIESGNVMVACSGGADSLALLAATVAEARSRPWRVIGVVVDHGLQEGSQAHTEHVVAQMVALGVDETASARVTVDPAGRGPEAAAREARYSVLGELADHFEARAVLLGHTRDDQAETVLLGLTRGSGGRSMAGMRRRFERYRRPLLDIGREETVLACEEEGLAFWTDPHNLDPAFTRVRVRQVVLPMIEDELGPGVATTLARTADLLREDMECLDALADERFAAVRDGAGAQVTVSATGLEGAPAAILSRVLRLAALEAGAIGAELFRVHVRAMLPLVEGRGHPGVVQLPGLVTAYRDGDLLRFRPT